MKENDKSILILFPRATPLLPSIEYFISWRNVTWEGEKPEIRIERKKKKDGGKARKARRFQAAFYQANLQQRLRGYPFCAI